jgi:ABC-type sugar transport system substrate-binding protein
MARTAVVAGTATAVSNRVSRRQANRWAQNDQAQYAYLGASWLFKQLNGKGDVVYMRGIAGHPADTDRDTGFKKALAENPGIKVVKEVATKWDPATGTQQINDIMSSGTKFDGIWTSGIDSNIVDALKAANHPYVPIVGADNAGFVTQLPVTAAEVTPAGLLFHLGGKHTACLAPDQCGVGGSACAAPECS